MTTRHPDAKVHLDTGELLDIHDGEGSLVTCLSGVVWITQSNDPRDIVIGEGESFKFDRSGIALINALAGPAIVAVQSAAPRLRFAA